MPEFFDVTIEKLRSKAIENLVSGGKITNASDGSLSRQLIDVGIEELYKFYSLLNFYVNMSRLNTAVGSYLDYIGESRGVARLEATRAVVSREDKLIKFYSTDGVTPLYSLLTLGKVPKNTTISSSDGSVSYTVTEDVFVDQTQTEVYVPAESSGTGSSQNVGKGVLTSHDLGISTVSVTNTDAINFASDAESDENYRFRILSSLHSRAGATPDAIVNAIRALPGVADVIIRPFIDGIGSFKVFLIPVGNSVSSQTILQAENLLSSITALGVSASVLTPIPLPVEITVQLELSSRANEKDIKNEVRKRILDYLAAIPIGGTFIYNELVQQVMDASDSIVDMKVLLYRFREEPFTLRNIPALEDEMFVPNNNVSNPIQVI